MKNNLNFALLLISFVLAVSACKKDVPREELLTSGSWKGESIIVTILGQSTNVHDQLEPCAKDDLTRFKTDKTVEIDEGPSKCDPADPQTYSEGPWSLSENDSKLTFSGVTYDIQELTDNRLKLKGSFSELGITGTAELTFVK